MKIIPIESLESSPDARRAVAEADVVIGIDLATQRAYTVFGTPSLEESIQIGKDGALRTAQVGFHNENGEFQQLVAWVKAIKAGRDQLPAADVP